MQAAEKAGRRLRFLPPDSPDLNPIRIAFSKFKAFRKRGAARTVHDLWDALVNAVDIFTPAECRNDFAAAGYEPEQSENSLMIEGAGLSTRPSQRIGLVACLCYRQSDGWL